MRTDRFQSALSIPRLVLIICAWLLCMNVVYADLLLTAPPRESPAAGAKLYGPLAARLSEILQQKVVYKFPGNWLAYQRDMRKDMYDIIFDGPHFISWRMRNLEHTPVARLPGYLQFVTVTSEDNAAINKPEDLIGRRMCGMPPPNLTTLSIYAYYKHPARLPVVIPIKGGPKKVYEAFKEGKCEAATLPNFFVNRNINEVSKDKVKTIYSTVQMSNQGITVSKRVSKESIEAMRNELTRGDLNEATKNILVRFGGKARAFIPVTADDYQQEYEYLEGVIYGW